MFGFKSRKTKELEEENRILKKEINNLEITINSVEIDKSKLVSHRNELIKKNEKLSFEKQNLIIDNERFDTLCAILENENKKLKKAVQDAEKNLEEVRKKEEEYNLLLNRMSLHPDLIKPFETTYKQSNYLNSIKQGILQHALDEQPKIEEISICAVVHSCTTNDKYFTSLVDCTCRDNKIRKRPCKHMLYLAYLIGLLQIEQKEQSYSNQVISKNHSEILTQNKKIKILKDEIQIQEFKHKRLDLENQKLEKQNSDLRIKVEEIINGSIAEATRITLKVQSEIDEIRFNKNRKSKK